MLFKSKVCNVMCILIMVLLAIHGSASCVSAAGSERPVTLKVAHVVNTNHPYHLGLLRFKEVVETKSNGSIKIEIFPSGQLGDERDSIEALQLGTLDMCLAATAPLTGFEEKFMIFDLPFIFSSKEHAHQVLDGEIGQEILGLLEAKGIKGLTYFEVGFRHFTNNKRPIVKPTDLSGLKMRVMQTPVHLKSMEVWGANPVAMGPGEVFTALQQGAIDGQENPLPIIETFKFYEVQKYLSLSGHFFTGTPLLIQQKIWNRLKSNQQQILLEAAAAGRDVCRAENDEQEEKLLDKFKQYMAINEVDKIAFREASQAVYDFFTPTVGKDLIERILNSGVK